MAKHMLSMCIFCFICATHSPCASHAAIDNDNNLYHQHLQYNDPNNPPLVETIRITSREKLKPKLIRSAKLNDDRENTDDDSLLTREENYNSLRLKRHSDNKINNKDSNNSDNVNNIDNKRKVTVTDAKPSYIKEIFFKYGNGDTMSIEGFERLVASLNLVQVLLKKNEENNMDKNVASVNINETKNSTLCLDNDLSKILEESIRGKNVVDHVTFLETCPRLLYPLIAGQCLGSAQDFHVHNLNVEDNLSNNFYTWLYSTAAVFVISACGIFSVAIIPVMQNSFYKPLIQFLVALAVGTLAGDALLHLLPHAMSSVSHSHGEISNGHGEHEHHIHNENMWKGFVAMLGLTFFFIMEKIILFAGKWRKGKQKHKAHARVKVDFDGRDSKKRANDTQCMDKYSSYPYCYKDILDDPNTKYMESDKTATTVLELGSNSDVESYRKSRSPTREKLDTIDNYECATDLLHVSSAVDAMVPNNDGNDGTAGDYTVILREHETKHHGHSHTHGHVHAAPQNLKSVAWMVIMGDGLHNFTDGMAIGAAFSGGTAGGFSTAVAVFCHELPHELGDFAMLIKAGMSIKQALVYNLLSSVLCIFGNIFGLWLGNTEYASSWVFAAAAGMFIYIALVDMIPELSSAHEDESNFAQCVLHLTGLLLGFGIMTVIALYEHDLKTIFNDVN